MWAKISAPKINPRRSSAALDVMTVVFVTVSYSLFFFRAKLSNRTVGREGSILHYSAWWPLITSGHGAQGTWLVRLRS